MPAKKTAFKSISRLESNVRGYVQFTRPTGANVVEAAITLARKHKIQTWGH